MTIQFSAELSVPIWAKFALKSQETSGTICGDGFVAGD